jgi:hypothetical protein
MWRLPVTRSRWNPKASTKVTRSLVQPVDLPFRRGQLTLANCFLLRPDFSWPKCRASKFSSITVGGFKTLGSKGVFAEAKPEKKLEAPCHSGYRQGITGVPASSTNALFLPQIR